VAPVAPPPTPYLSDDNDFTAPDTGEYGQMMAQQEYDAAPTPADVIPPVTPDAQAAPSGNFDTPPPTSDYLGSNSAEDYLNAGDYPAAIKEYQRQGDAVGVALAQKAAATEDQVFGRAAAGPSPQGISPAYSSDLNAYKAEIAKQPVETQPRWWQRALGAAAGFGAGYSNAASRTKHPIDVGEMEQNILHPGYQSKLAEWQSRVAPLKEAADIEGQRQAASLKAEQMGSTTALQSAQADRARALAQMSDRRFQGQWKADTKTGELYNTTTGEHIAAPETPQDRLITAQALVAAGGLTAEQVPYFVNKQPLPAPKAMEATPPKQANEWQTYLDAAGGDPNKARQLYVNDQARLRAVAPGIAADARNTPKPATPKPATPKPATPQSMTAIEARKNTRLQQAEAAANKSVATGTGKAEAMAALNVAKQTIQNDYEGEIAAATGSAPGHFEYGTQPAPAQAPGGGGRGGPVAAQVPVIRKYNPATGKLE
jgi:hypothetical protein